MTTATLIDPVARYRMLHDFGLRPGKLAPIRAFVTALQQARIVGKAEAFWACLNSKEREYIIRFKDCPNTPWLYIDGLSPVPQSPVYVPPNVWYTPRLKINPLRIRGGLLTVVKPNVLLLEGPKIAGLLPAVCPTFTPHNISYRNGTPVQPPTLDYWQAVAILENVRFMEQGT